MSHLTCKINAGLERFLLPSSNESFINVIRLQLIHMTILKKSATTDVHYYFCSTVYLDTELNTRCWKPITCILYRRKVLKNL